MWVAGLQSRDFIFVLFFASFALDSLSHLFGRPADMRRDVQEIFRVTPHQKQVMMFSATLSKDIRVTCKKFMANVGWTPVALLVDLHVF